MPTLDPTERDRPHHSARAVAPQGDVSDGLNVLYVITALDTGGAEVGMCRLLDGLDEDRYDVTVVTLNGYDEEFVEQRVTNVDAIVDCKRLRTPQDASTLASAVLEADVIVGSLFHSVIVARLAGIVNRNALTATWQHSVRFKSRRRKMLYGLSNPLSDVLLADSEPVAAMIRDEFDVDEGVVETVPLAGIPLDKYRQRDHRRSDSIVVGSIGRLLPVKNYRTLVTVAAGLADEGIEFRIAGDGPERSALKRRIREVGADNVTLVGEVTSPTEFLEGVDIYVQPSLNEGLCIAVVEAMATGLPVVATAVGGIVRTVTDKENGYLHDPGDISGFRRSIRKLADSPTMRQRFGDRGRAIVEQNYSRELLVEEFERAILEGST